MSEMSDLSRFQHPRYARMYERISADSERRGTAAYRDRTLAGLSGRVLEVGAGNGLNFGHYPATVTEVVAIEPEDRLRAVAERARYFDTPEHPATSGQHQSRHTAVHRYHPCE